MTVQARNPHVDDYDVVWHVHYLFESDPSTERPRAMDVVMHVEATSLRAIANRVARLTDMPYGSIFIASCYVKGYK